MVKALRQLSAFMVLAGMLALSPTQSSKAGDLFPSDTLNSAITYSGNDISSKTMRVRASSCIGEDFCMFVGTSSNLYLEIAFGDPKNFSTMNQVRFRKNGEFSDVTCLSRNWCTVVGTTYGDPYVISGDPNTFSDSSLINLANINQTIRLTSITCITQTSCLAAGNTDPGDAVYFSGDPATWTGAKVVTVNPFNGFGLARQFIRCLSVNYCVLAGQVQKDMTINSVFWSGSYATFAKAKNAAEALKTWSKTATNIYGLWCFAVDSCLVQVGIGIFDDRSAVLKGSPKSWKTLEIVGGHSGLGGMDCLSISSCSASVGINVNGKIRTYAYNLSNPETWAKTKPVEISSLITPRSGDSVHCDSKNCYMFGFAADNSVRMLTGNAGSFANTTFQPASENVGYQNQVIVNSLDCVSDSSCVAVGTFFKNGSYYSMSAAFNPAAWDSAKLNVFAEKMQFDTETTPPLSALRAVTCQSETFCVAVGNNSDLEPSFAVGNPSTWKLKSISGLPVKTSLGYLSCTIKEYCIAIGAAGEQEAKDTKLVILAGNPANWSSTKPKIVDFGDVIEPSGLTCFTKAVCLSLLTTQNNPRSGNYYIGDQTTITKSLLKHFDTMSSFNALTCLSKTNCLLIGSGLSFNSPKKGVPNPGQINPTLTLGAPGAWTSRVMNIVTNQNPAKVDSILRGPYQFSNDHFVYTRPVGFVAADCLSGTECYLVGFDTAGNAVVSKVNPTSTGSFEAIQQALPQGLRNANFDAVSCASTQCFAMGNSDKGTFIVTLASPVQ